MEGMPTWQWNTIINPLNPTTARDDCLHGFHRSLGAEVALKPRPIIGPSGAALLIGSVTVALGVARRWAFSAGAPQLIVNRNDLALVDLRRHGDKRGALGEIDKH